MIGIVDYGSGNIRAIGNILGRFSIPFAVVSSPEDLRKADKIILPGVGAFDQAMGQLDRSGLRQALDALVLQSRVPILGICVGMQLFAATSEEGQATGLGWINGRVRRFDHSKFSQATHLPHMGWNTVDVRPHPIFRDVDLSTGYYFLHSYYFDCEHEADVLGVTEYGVRFASAVHRDNICGVQFHPEKSHKAGVQLIRNFATEAD